MYSANLCNRVVVYCCWLDVNVVEEFCDAMRPVNPEGLGLTPSICSQARVQIDTACSLKCGDGYMQTGPTEYECQFLNGSAVWTPTEWPSCRGTQHKYVVCKTVCIHLLIDEIHRRHLSVDRCIARLHRIHVYKWCKLTLYNTLM